jgi:hypothetical protein
MRGEKKREKIKMKKEGRKMKARGRSDQERGWEKQLVYKKIGCEEEELKGQVKMKKMLFVLKVRQKQNKKKQVTKKQ